MKTIVTKNSNAPEGLSPMKVLHEDPRSFAGINVPLHMAQQLFPQLLVENIRKNREPVAQNRGFGFGRRGVCGEQRGDAGRHGWERCVMSSRWK